ncbi:hypothetical protein [Nesterenkonia sp. F]|uniref:hypothetical protein n=1 Tax=Nesterenkonia sp. F TaxID=795955 RepID=UPI000255D98C|nr:hypothetical protein [Nesterenkonia sp. F]
MTEKSTTSTKIAPRTTAAGLAGLALLALTACGGGGEEPAAAESESPEVPPAPEYTEIESDVWDTMLAAESVTIEADMPAGLMDQQAAEGDRTIQEYAGAMDGSASTFRQESGDVTTEMRLVDGSAYVPGEVELASIERQSGGSISASDYAEDFEGRWIDYSDQVDPSGASPESFLIGLRSSMEGQSGAEALDSAAETRDGEDVWVYTAGEELEIVVRAGDEPVLLGFEGEQEGSSLSVQFAAWNASEGPEAPAAEDVMTIQEATQIVTG